MCQLTSPRNTPGADSTINVNVAAVKANTALCWGGNFFGQLGDATKTDNLRIPLAGRRNGSSGSSVLAAPADQVTDKAMIIVTSQRRTQG